MAILKSFGVMWISLVLLASGCINEAKRYDVCVGKPDTESSISALQNNYSALQAFRGHGDCIYRYRDSDGRYRQESINVKMWVDPPAFLYFQGEIAFDPKGVIVGTNESEFWFGIRFKEMSDFWWGEWSSDYAIKHECIEKLALPLNPAHLAEAFGRIKFSSGTSDNIILGNIDGYDVLSYYANEGVLVKRVHITCCDYLVRKIEYYDKNENIISILHCNQYERISDSTAAIPTHVQIIDPTHQCSITITIKGFKLDAFSQALKNRLFNRPSFDGYEHLYKVFEDCNVVEYTQ